MEFRKTSSSQCTFAGSSLTIPAGSSASVFFIHKNEEISKKIKLGLGSSLRIYSLYSKNSRIKNDFSLGKGAKLEIKDIFSGPNSIISSIPINEKNCTLSLVAKGTVRKGESAKYFAIASIGEGASGANVNLEEHAYLLGKGARVDFLPGLEIRNNDVSARHASSISEIDWDKIFYLMSRGLAEKEAKDEIVSGFLAHEASMINSLFPGLKLSSGTRFAQL